MVIFMLLFYLKAYPDETLCSLLYRTAKENLMDNLNWIFFNFSQYSKNNIHTNEVNWLTGEKLKKMAEFLSITNETAKLLTFRFTLEELDLHYNNISKNAWFLYSKARCCPQCLKEQLYYRKRWSSSHSLICTKHKIFLVEECSNCKKQFDIRDIINDRCQKCKIQIINQTGTKVRDIQMEKYQNIIDEILTEKDFSYNHLWIKNSKDFLITLEFIACWAARLINLQKFSIKEYKFEYNGKALERNHLKNAKTIIQSTCIYFFAFEIIDNWPNGFNKFLELAEIENKPLFRYFLKYVIPSLHGKALWPISKALTNYLTHFKMSYPNETVFITSDEIKHLNKKFNASILNSYEFELQQFKYQGVVFTFINTKEFNTFIKTYENSLTKEELRFRWGTSAKSTSSILQNELIENVITLTSGSIIQWVIPKESIESVELYLRLISKPLIDKAFTLNQAFEWIGPENSHLLLSGIINKKIGIQWTEGNFAGCMVARKEVYNYMKEQILIKGGKDQYISFKDMTFLLGIKKSDLVYWLNTKRFGTVQTNYPEFINPEQYYYFSEKYITTLELSILLNLSMKQVLKKQSIGHFPVVAGPKLSDGKRILYDRIKIFS